MSHSARTPRAATSPAQRASHASHASAPSANATREGRDETEQVRRLRLPEVRQVESQGGERRRDGRDDREQERPRRAARALGGVEGEPRHAHDSPRECGRRRQRQPDAEHHEVPVPDLDRKRGAGAPRDPAVGPEARVERIPEGMEAAEHRPHERLAEARVVRRRVETGLRPPRLPGQVPVADHQPAVQAQVAPVEPSAEHGDRHHVRERDRRESPDAHALALHDAGEQEESRAGREQQRGHLHEQRETHRHAECGRVAQAHATPEQRADTQERRSGEERRVQRLVRDVGSRIRLEGKHAREEHRDRDQLGPTDQQGARKTECDPHAREPRRERRQLRHHGVRTRIGAGGLLEQRDRRVVERRVVRGPAVRRQRQHALPAQMLDVGEVMLRVEARRHRERGELAREEPEPADVHERERDPGQTRALRREPAPAHAEHHARPARRAPPAGRLAGGARARRTRTGERRRMRPRVVGSDGRRGGTTLDGDAPARVRLERGSSKRARSSGGPRGFHTSIGDLVGARAKPRCDVLAAPAPPLRIGVARRPDERAVDATRDAREPLRPPASRSLEPARARAAA